MRRGIPIHTQTHTHTGGYKRKISICTAFPYYCPLCVLTPQKRTNVIRISHIRCTHGPYTLCTLYRVPVHYVFYVIKRNILSCYTRERAYVRACVYRLYITPDDVPRRPGRVIRIYFFSSNSINTIGHKKNRVIIGFFGFFCFVFVSTTTFWVVRVRMAFDS